jgi:hypothetical protein
MRQLVCSILLAALAPFTSGCAGADLDWAPAELAALGCKVESVIRFAVVGDGGTGALYEWKDVHVSRIKQRLDRKGALGQFPEGSFYKWEYWGDAVQTIPRDAAGTGLRLGTPYSRSPDGRYLAAGASAAKHPESQPSRLAILPIAVSQVAVIVDLHDPIESMSWSPRGDEIVVATRREQYTRRSLREKFASAIGHPIPLEDLTLTVIAFDGATRCSLEPFRQVPYGMAYVRWDSD